MTLALALATLLAADSGAPPSTVPAERTHDSDRPRLLAVSAAGVLLGAGAATGAWLDRDGAFGRGCAIAGGTLGTAMVGAALAYGISLLTRGPDGDVFDAVAAGFATLYGFLAGLAVGAVVSAFASAPPGTPRGVLGLVGGGLGLVGSTIGFIWAWDD